MYAVTPGFFTIDEMITDIQEQIDADGGVLNQDPSTSLVISHDSITDKVVFRSQGLISIAQLFTAKITTDFSIVLHTDWDFPVNKLLIIIRVLFSL